MSFVLGRFVLLATELWETRPTPSPELVQSMMACQPPVSNDNVKLLPRSFVVPIVELLAASAIGSRKNERQGDEFFCGDGPVGLTLEYHPLYRSESGLPKTRQNFRTTRCESRTPVRASS